MMNKEEFITPGSNKAIEMGCLCPVLDNECGQGYMGNDGIFVINEECPLHGKRYLNGYGEYEK